MKGKGSGLFKKEKTQKNSNVLKKGFSIKKPGAKKKLEGMEPKREKGDSVKKSGFKFAKKQGQEKADRNKKGQNFTVVVKNILQKGKSRIKGTEKNVEFKRVEKVAWYRGIQMKLWSLVVIPIVFLVVLGVVSYSKASSGIEDSYISSLSSAVDLTTSYYEFVFNSLENDYNELLVDGQLRTYATGGYLRMDSTDGTVYYNDKYKEFNYDITSNKFLKNIYVLTDEDQSIATTNSSEEGMYSALAATKQGKMVNKSDKSEYFYFGTIPEVDDVLKTEEEDYAVRVIHKIPKAEAYFVLDMNREEMQSIVGQLNAGEGGIVAFVTRDGSEVLGVKEGEEEQKSEENKEKSQTATKYFAGRDYYKKAMASEGPVKPQEVTVDGKDYVFMMAKIGDTQCSICCLVPQAVIQEQASDIEWVTIVLVIISILVSGLFGVIVARGMSKTIASILRQIKKVSQGDLTVQVATRRKDEFAMLATGISDMIAHTKHLIQKVESVSTDLTSISEEVIESSEKFLGSSKGIEESVGEIEVGTTNQAEHSVKCLGEMDQLSQRIQVLNKNTQKISEIATDTNHSIQKGMQSMSVLNEKSHSTAEITNVVIESIEKLEKQSRSIGQIVGAINDIASETNLLSLNASIEAARAGEAGKGFSVVASEIRKLADQSMASAEQIQAIISEIVMNTKKAVETAKEADNIVQEQQEAVDDTTGAFQTMEQQVNVLMAELEGILQSVNRIEQTRSVTLSAIEEISAVSEQTAAAAATVSNVVTNQLEGVEELSQNSERLSTSAEDLSNAINQFTVR